MMKTTFIILTSILVYFGLHSSEDIKYASQEIQHAKESAVKSLTPLMEAILEKDESKIKEIIKQENLEINAQDNYGQTALMWAITHKLHVDIIKSLLGIKNIDLNIQDKQGLNALYHAIINGNDEVVKALLDACARGTEICPWVNMRDKIQLTPLARAAIDENFEIVKLLLQAGANPTAIVTRSGKNMPAAQLIKTDDKEITALLKDKEKEYKDRGLAVINALKDNKPDDARKLLVLGIDVNATDKHR